MYLEKNMVIKDVCTPLFIAAVFTIARTWKQCKYSSTEEWIKQVWYICTMEYYSAMKKEKRMPFAATWMNLETAILNKVSQTEKEKYYMIPYIYEILKNGTNELIYKIEIELQM